MMQINTARVLTVAVVFTAFLALAGSAYAAGGPTNPYVTNPRDTGLSTDILYFVGLSASGLGLSMLGTVKAVSQKIL